MDWLATPIPLYITAALYILQAGGYAVKGDTGMSLVFVAYCIANVGLIMSFNK